MMITLTQTLMMYGIAKKDLKIVVNQGEPGCTRVYQGVPPVPVRYRQNQYYCLTTCLNKNQGWGAFA